ncbi:hypothetical protein OJAV_G00038350 [Oryzias javanicus]|uniref:Uncharacterized protein n=1 Tax=Oryzias javanicus TaxID=123683 RepID=A0A3S2MER0_ORYJA|nr:hypothetical protein OJAV_G00038350 [Oryzias javanicus]
MRATKRPTRFCAPAVPGPRADDHSVTEEGGHTGLTDPLPRRPGCGRASAATAPPVERAPEPEDEELKVRMKVCEAQVPNQRGNT